MGYFCKTFGSELKRPALELSQQGGLDGAIDLTNIERVCGASAQSGPEEVRLSLDEVCQRVQ